MSPDPFSLAWRWLEGPIVNPSRPGDRALSGSGTFFAPSVVPSGGSSVAPGGAEVSLGNDLDT